MAKGLNIKPIYQIILFFLIAQGLALFVGKTLIDNAASTAEYEALRVAPAEPGDIFNAFYLIAMVLVMAVVLVLIIRFVKRDFVIRGLEFLSTVFAASIVFFVFFTTIGLQPADLYGFVIALILYIAKAIDSRFRNVLAILASAGVGALIGFSIDPIPAIAFVILIAIYDMVAVWFTGHMVELAKRFVKMKTAFTIGAGGTKKTITKIKGKFRSKTEKVHLELGTGDLALPASLMVSVYKLGIVFPFVAILGSVIGLYVVLMKAQKEKAVYPAMPWIGAGAIILTLVAWIINIVLIG